MDIETIFEFLKDQKGGEEEAYRFGVIAVESADRFGYELPEHLVAHIDDWILHSAGVRFVCPESDDECR